MHTTMKTFALLALAFVACTPAITNGQDLIISDISLTKHSLSYKIVNQARHIIYIRRLGNSWGDKARTVVSCDDKGVAVIHNLSKGRYTRNTPSREAIAAKGEASETLDLDCADWDIPFNLQTIIHVSVLITPVPDPEPSPPSGSRVPAIYSKVIGGMRAVR
jgi:hypothetical protein